MHDTAAATPLLSVSDLTISFPNAEGIYAPAVDQVSFSVDAGEIVGLAGESGSGKTLSALSALGLLPPTARTSGSVTVAGSNVLTLSKKQLRDLRGNDVAMIFQDPMAALHPMLTIERQLTEHMRYHKGYNKREARARAEELLEQVRIPDPSRTLASHPHQFSGGMRQRIAIAMALACKPQLLLADEPTTALDVTVQAGVLRLLDTLRREENLGVLIVTHDLGVLSAIADTVVVMYAGRTVESGPVAEVVKHPRHPYTRGLLDALPHTDSTDTTIRPIPGTPPRLGEIPDGCAFHPRCSRAIAACAQQRPAALTLSTTRTLACPVDPYAEEKTS